VFVITEEIPQGDAGNRRPLDPGALRRGCGPPTNMRPCCAGSGLLANGDRCGRHVWPVSLAVSPDQPVRTVHCVFEPIVPHAAASFMRVLNMTDVICTVTGARVATGNRRDPRGCRAPIASSFDAPSRLIPPIFSCTASRPERSRWRCLEIVGADQITVGRAC